MTGGKRFRAWPTNAKKPFCGARIEVFAPGDKKLVALWRSRPIANCEPDQVIPVLSFRDISAILRAAREAARCEVPDPPVVEEAPAPEPDAARMTGGVTLRWHRHSLPGLGPECSDCEAGRNG